MSSESTFKQETFANYRKRRDDDKSPIKSITQPAEGSALEASNKRIADIWKKTATMSQDEYNDTVKTDSTAVRDALNNQSANNIRNVGRQKPSFENLGK